MTGRHGPPLFSLNYNLALAAVNVMRRREADPHHGQGPDRPINRPNRLWHPPSTTPTSHLQREASIDVVVPAPRLDEHLRLPQAVEDLALEQLVAQLAVE